MRKGKLGLRTFDYFQRYKIEQEIDATFHEMKNYHSHKCHNGRRIFWQRIQHAGRIYEQLYDLDTVN